MGKAVRGELRSLAKNAVKEGVKESVKEVAKGIREALASAAPLPPAPMAERGWGAAGPPVVLPPPQLYPAMCECEENPRAELTPEGNRIYRCHSCAAKGMGVRDFKTAIEARAFQPARPRRMSASDLAGASALPGQLLGGRKTRRVRRRTRTRRTRARRTQK